MPRRGIRSLTDRLQLPVALATGRRARARRVVEFRPAPEQTGRMGRPGGACGAEPRRGG
jgi:hypothetical protein